MAKIDWKERIKAIDDQIEVLKEYRKHAERCIELEHERLLKEWEKGWR